MKKTLIILSLIGLFIACDKGGLIPDNRTELYQLREVLYFISHNGEERVFPEPTPLITEKIPEYDYLVIQNRVYRAPTTACFSGPWQSYALAEFQDYFVYVSPSHVWLEEEGELLIDFDNMLDIGFNTYLYVVDKIQYGPLELQYMAEKGWLKIRRRHDKMISYEFEVDMVMYSRPDYPSEPEIISRIKKVRGAFEVDSEQCTFFSCPVCY